MGVEGDALLLDLAQICQGEYLEAAGIREDRPVPPHELVKSTELVNCLISGSYMQMVSVAQRNLRIYAPEVIGT